MTRHVDRALPWLLAAGHLAACLHYFPPREIFSGEPVLTSDWVQHYFQAVRTARYLANGSFLGYCTTWSAGFVDGFVGLVNNKPFGLLLFATPQKVHPLAFNLAVLASLFVFPPLVYATARRLGHDRRQAAAAMGLAIACWYGSMLFRVFWRGGSALFGVGVAVALWSAAVLHSRWSGDARAPSIGVAALGVAAVPWVHSGAILVVAVVVTCAYIATFRSRGWRLGELAVVGGLTLLTSLPWLLPFVRYADLRRSLDYGIYPGGFDHLLYDFMRAPLRWGSGPREETAILLPLLLLASLGAPALRRGNRLFVLGTSSAIFAGLAYGGRALGLGALQPYRFVIPLAAILSLAAAAALPKRGEAPPMQPLVAIVAALALLLVADRLRVTAATGDYLGAGLGATENAALEALRSLAAPNGQRVEGRILLEGDWFAEPVDGRPRNRRVSYSFVGFEGALDAEFIGAPAMSAVTLEEEASFWRGRLFGRKLEAWDRAAFLQLCETYDVRWAVTLHERTAEWLTAFSPDVERVAERGRVKIFRILRPASRYAANADGRTIELSRADASPATLPYHWNRLLEASPPAELRPVPTGITAALRFVEIVPPSPGRYRIGFASARSASAAR